MCRLRAKPSKLRAEFKNLRSERLDLGLVCFCHVANLLLVAGDLPGKTICLRILFRHSEVLDLKWERMARLEF